jgi:hypothetical protein
MLADNVLQSTLFYVIFVTSIRLTNGIYPLKLPCRGLRVDEGLGRMRKPHNEPRPAGLTHDDDTTRGTTQALPKSPRRMASLCTLPSPAILI